MVGICIQSVGARWARIPASTKRIVSVEQLVSMLEDVFELRSTRLTGVLSIGEKPTSSLEDDRILKCAKVAIDKRRQFFPRPKLFIQLLTVRRMIGSMDEGVEAAMVAMLSLKSYVFLLRVPSEGLPMVRGGVGFDSHGQKFDEQAHQSVIWLEGGLGGEKTDRRALFYIVHAGATHAKTLSKTRALEIPWRVPSGG